MYIFSLPGLSPAIYPSDQDYSENFGHFQRILMRTWFPALFVFQDIQNKVKIPPKDNFLTFKRCHLLTHILEESGIVFVRGIDIGNR